MISKSQIKLIGSLHHKKFRREHGLFIAEGEKVCRDLFESGWKIHSVYFTKDYNRKFTAEKNQFIAEPVTEKEMEKISSLTTPQEVLAVVEIPSTSWKSGDLENELTLMLDEIKDPGNLGTIIRIADWFGIKNVICSMGCADAYNPKTVQATMGSLFRVNVSYKILEDVLGECRSKKLAVYGTVLDGTNIYDTDLHSSGVILIGSESHGISNSLLPFITSGISIPSFSKSSVKKADSLNAAMAAAIVCSEFRRRK